MTRQLFRTGLFHPSHLLQQPDEAQGIDYVMSYVLTLLVILGIMETGITQEIST